MRANAAYTHLSQLARLGLPSRAVIPAMLETLETLVPGHFCMFMWIDDQGAPADFHLPWIVPAALEVNSRLLASNDLETASFTNLVRLGTPYGVAAEVCRTPEFLGSEFYNECCRPYGIGHGFDVLVYDGLNVCGAVVATREAGSAAYSTREIETLRTTAAAFAHALAADRLAPPSRFAPSGDHALLTLDDEGRVLDASRGYESLLRELLGVRFNARFRFADLHLDARDFFRSLLTMKRWASSRETPHGRIVVRLYPAESIPGAGGESPTSRWYALLERQIPLALEVTKALARLDLSPREREVARHLVLAESPQRMLRTLGIRPHTLHDYKRRIYRRLGVGSRDELARLVTTTAPSPTRH